MRNIDELNINQLDNVSGGRRLQEVDRSKMWSMLSDILKAASDTTRSIVQNLK